MNTHYLIKGFKKYEYFSIKQLSIAIVIDIIAFYIGWNLG